MSTENPNENNVCLSWGRLTWTLALDNAFNRVNRGNWFKFPDTKDSSTEVQFYYSPQACMDLCAEIQDFGSGLKEGNRSVVVAYSPLIVKYTSPDKLPLVSSSRFKITSFRRYHTGENFLSWGITEKLQLDRIHYIHEILPKLPPYACVALTGIMEEVRFLQTSDDEYVYFNYQGLPWEDFVQLVKEPLSLQLQPLGIIINKERPNAPIVPVIVGTCNSMPYPSDAHGLCVVLQEFKSLGVFLANVSLKQGYDSWAKVVARALIRKQRDIGKFAVCSLDQEAYKYLYRTYRSFIGEPIIPDLYLAEA